MKRIDSHCHVFNILMVGVKALLEQVHETSELVSTEKLAKTPVVKQDEKRALAFEKLKKIAELIAIFTGDSEKILSRLDKHYKGDFQLFPLMFDGDFLLDSASPNDVKLLKGELAQVQEHIKGQKNNRLKSSKVDTKESLTNEELELLLEFFNKVESGIDASQTKDTRLKSAKEDGFTRQYNQLVDIKKSKQYKDKVYPFLGVDPRRNNINTFFPQVGKEQIFAGIKVYPPNGFSPTDPRLDAMYAKCSKERIPIISHCSYGGFATPAMQIEINGFIVPLNSSEPVQSPGVVTFEKGITDGFTEMVRERAHTLNHPKIWRKVLEKYPDLLLVLAHFGEGSDDWRNEINSLMNQYENLHTDISCISNVGSLQQVKSLYDSEPKVKSKLLYGSDYFLDMFFNDSFNDYYQRIQGVFTNGSFDQISISNPQEFMAKWY